METSQPSWVLLTESLQDAINELELLLKELKILQEQRLLIVFDKIKQKQADEKVKKITSVINTKIKICEE